MLHAAPELVHLCEVDEQELNGVADGASIALKLRPHIWQQSSGHLPRRPPMLCEHRARTHRRFHGGCFVSLMYQRAWTATLDLSATLTEDHSGEEFCRIYLHSCWWHWIGQQVNPGHWC